MSTPNTGHPTAESREVPKDKKENTGNMAHLLKEGISRAFGEPIDPLKFNAYKKNPGNIEDMVRGHMKDIKVAHFAEWEDISEIGIRDLKKSHISEQILYSCSGLILRRKKAITRIAEAYPSIRDTSAWEPRLMSAIEDMDEAELMQLATRKASMKKLLSSTFPGSADVRPRENYNFGKIFHDIDSTSATDAEKREIQKIHQYYERHRSYPDSIDIGKILALYKNKPASRKLEILRDFDGEFDIRFAYENGLIKKSSLEDFATVSFGVLYTDLGKTEQEAFINNLCYNEEITLSAHDVEFGNIDAIYTTPKKLQQVGGSIVRKLGIRASAEVETNRDSIPAKMKALEPKDDEGNSIETDMFETFKLLIKKELRSPDNSKCLVDNIDSLLVGSVLMFDGEENPKYFRIKQTTDEHGLPLDADNGGESGVLIEGLPIQDGMIQEKQSRFLTYTDFYQFLRNSTSDVQVLSKEVFDARLTKDSKEAGVEGKIYDASDILSEEVNASNIVSKLDALDTEGRAYGFEAGTYFSAPETEKDGKSETKIWKVLKVHGNFVDISAPRGTREENIPLEMILGLAKAGKIQRSSKITGDDDFVHLLSDYGISDHAHIDKDEIIEEHEDHGKKTKHTVRCFAGEDGHIRVTGVKDGMVYFGNYEGGDTSKTQAYAEKFGAKKAHEAHYQPEYLTYGAFLEYLKTNKLKASSDDILDPHAPHTDHAGHHHPHTHGSLLSKIGRMQTFGSMWKGAEMIWHSIEHTLEKGSKLDAARFAMQASKFMPYFDGVQAQIYADIVDESKSITEKYKNKIGNLMGPAQRLKCLHIVQNTDSRPEEVMAAIQFMVSSYGHLYAEDIKQHQSIVTKPRLKSSPYGTYAFLDAFIRSTGMPGGDGKPPHIYWRLKAYDKAIPEMGDKEGHEGEPTEEQLLHALFKSIDGNPEQFPYAGSVVKAIGGPGGFEKDWKFEGFENAYEKGKKQTTMVNAQGRLNKAVGYLATHEIYKAMGGMEMVAAKQKDPKYQALPFVWAVGGYTKYASPTALQKLKGYAGNGISFHAYGFLREEKDNILYRDTVRLALEELVRQGRMKSEDIGKFDTICKRMDHGPESADDTDKKHEKISPPVAMMKFWQEHQAKGLNDMLQNKNGWLTVAAKNSKTVKSYREKFTDAHQEQLDDEKIPSGEPTGWYDEHGYQSLIMSTDEKTGLKSLERNLIKIKFPGPNRGGRPMNSEHEKKIWNYIRKYMDKGLRDTASFLGDEETQKKQFLFHREEIVNYIAGQLSASEVKDTKDIERHLGTKSYTYFQDLWALGIDPHAIFDSSLISKNAESDYMKWKTNGVRGGESKVDDVIGAVSARANGASEHDAGYQRMMKKVVPERRPDAADYGEDTVGHSDGIDYKNDGD